MGNTQPWLSLKLTLHRLCFFSVLLLILSYAGGVPAAESIDLLEKRIRSATDPAEQARLYKEIGEQYVAQDQLAAAADAFTKALSLGGEQFSLGERLKMAIYLSWADRLDDSSRELRLIVAADPKNVAARTHLARVLSWAGELSEAIAEADRALKEAPDHHEASLVKANALQWQGRYSEAIAIYQKLFGTDSEFDARIGLTYTLLATGNRTGAVANVRLLKPADAREERELKRLAEAIDRETRPRVDTRYNFFWDSDDNRLHRYLMLADFRLGNQDLGFTFRHTDAQDRTRDKRAEDFTLRLFSHLTEALGVGAAVGFTQLGNGRTSNFPTGQFRIDGRLFRGTVGANVTREVLSDTAELIDNRIRMSTIGAYLSQPITDRFSILGGYAYKDFSDGNYANDVQLAAQYAVLLSPRILVGHRFRFLDFRRQTRSGFFDPSDYVANRVFSSLYWERPTYYAYLEVFLGHQTFRRNGARSDDFIQGGSGSIGIRPIPNLTIEVNAEGGNFAAGTVTGFTYFIVGPRLLFRF